MNPRLVAYQARIARVLDRADTAMQGGDHELAAMLSSHACVLTSGLIEATVRDLLLDWARSGARTQLLNFIESALQNFQNPKMAKIIELLRSWDPTWASALDAAVTDEERDAVDSVVNNKNQIAHGKNVSLSYVPMKRYYGKVLDCLNRIESLLPT